MRLHTLCSSEEELKGLSDVKKYKAAVSSLQEQSMKDRTIDSFATDVHRGRTPCHLGQRQIPQPLPE